MAKVIRSNPLTGGNSVNKISVSDIYSNFLRVKKSEASEATYQIYVDLGRRTIVPWLTELTDDNINAVTADIVRYMLDHYAEDHTESGTAFLYRHFKAFINWYWAEYEIQAENPLIKVKRKKVSLPPKEGITQAEVDKLLKAVKQHSQFPERDTALIMMLCDTGLRRRSIQDLLMRDVDTNRCELIVHEKDQLYHTKPFGTATCKAIRKYLLCLTDVKPDDPFWLTQDGKAMTYAGMREVLRRLSSAAGIEMHHFHDFRRYYGLQLYNATHDIFLVSRALDHKSVEVTKRYLAIDDRENAEAVRTFSPMDIKFRQTGVTVKRQ